MSDQPYALVAEFRGPDALKHAVERAREKGYRRIEAYSPFPVEGLAAATGFRERLIGPLMLAGAILGGLAGFGLQAWTSADFPLNVGGRPLIATPAFMLVTFELAVLGAVAAGVIAMLLLNRLPKLHHPLFEIEQFHFATADKFFLAIFADDRAFEAAAVRRFLRSLKPVSIAVAPRTEAPS